MTRLPGTAGFQGLTALVASSRLTNAIAAALAFGALSICLVVSVTVFTVKASMAMPVPM